MAQSAHQFTPNVNRRKGTDKPFELCFQGYSPDGETRLFHDDYYLSREELGSLKYIRHEYKSKQ